MSLASAGDVSNVSVTLPDILNINKDSTDGKDKTGKDAVVFHYGKVSQTAGNIMYCIHLLELFQS